MLINYINFFNLNSNDNNEFINIYLKIIEENENNSSIFFYLSYTIFSSQINPDIKKNFIEILEKKFEENFLVDNENSKMIFISSLLIIIEYHLENQIDDLKKIEPIKLLINNCDPNQVLFYLIKILNIIFLNQKGEIVEIFNIFKDLNSESVPNISNYENLNQDYIDLFLKLIESLINEKFEHNNILKVLKKENINIYYQTYKHLLFMIIKSKKVKMFKKLLSSENNIYPIVFYYKLIYSNDEEKLLIEKDIIDASKELIECHNNPFIFKLIELINYNKNNIIQMKPLSDEKKNPIDIKITINVLKTIYDSLKNYDLDLKNKKKCKYYLRGIINILITIYHICEMKEILFSNNKTFIAIFLGLVKIIEKLNLIYSNFCIKIDNLYGKIISELIFDSFIFLIMLNNDNEIKEFFKKTFIKESKEKDKNLTLFYIIDILKYPNLDKEIKTELQNYINDITKVNTINSLLKTKKTYNLDNCEIRKSLPNYKCISLINKVNFSIYFLGIISLFLYNETNKISDEEFTKYLIKSFIPLLNSNILTIKTKLKKYYNDEFYENLELYNLLKEFYNNSISADTNNLESLLDFFLALPNKLKSKHEIESFHSSLFIWKENKSENLNIKNEIDNNNVIQKKISFKQKNSEEIKENNNNKLNKKESNIIKDNINIEKKDNMYYSFLDDLKKRCLILNPKNMLIKRIFSHIYYNLIFYDKAFMYIKYKYLRKFPKANIYSKQLNYPSKFKNYSNFYEPKIFLRKDFNFYNNRYITISHDYLFNNNNNENNSNIKEIEPFLNKNLYSINFYKHNFNINEEKDRFDCELITSQFVYFGSIFFGEDYIYFDTKEIPFSYEKSQKDFNLDLFLKYLFSIRNRDNQTDKKKSLIIYNKDIKTIIKRRTLLIYQALEIYCINGKSYFFNLFKKDICNNAFNILNNIREKLDEENKFNILTENISEEVKKINNLVKNRDINNYKYISKLNFYSSRSFNDVNQYPIYPWIILNFDKIDNLFEIDKNDNEIIEYIDVEQDDKSNSELWAEPKPVTISKSENEQLYNEFGLRFFNYPLSMQKEERREHAIFKFKDVEIYESGKFRYHHGAHYSTSSYIFFYLMRNNPFTQCMIKLQNFSKENPNRAFTSFNDAIFALNTLSDNRELIPNLFCHIDYYCNLNCAYHGHKANGDIVDDFYYNKIKEYKFDLLSKYCQYVYIFRKLINSNLVSKFLPNWLDNIFGKNQIPDNPKKLEESCNIFSKTSYEEKMNLNKKVNKYIKKLNNKEMTQKDLAKKLSLKTDLINNFGITPHRILDNTIRLKCSKVFNNIPNTFCTIKKNIFFIKSNEDILILFKNVNDKENDKIKKIAIWNSKINNNKFENLEKKAFYPCGYIKELKKYDYKEKDKAIHKIPIFKPCYAMSKFIAFDKLFILTCRYLGNIFKIQNIDYYIDVLCEDFITCIICKESNKSNIDDIMIYTGLKNGKLIEWYFKKKLNLKGKLIFKEKRNCHCHKGAITCIELYENQNIIITGGEDKMIFIRKTYDFEILTAINLIYSYGNPIIEKEIDIVPTLIKVSELNFIYIMLYNYNTNKSFIRGYNLNGLFFAQSKEDDYMNICFTKNGNLLVSIYNQEKLFIFNCHNLNPYTYKYNIKTDNLCLELSEFLINYNKNIKKKKKEDIEDYLVWFDYNYKKQEFILLFENKIVKGCIEKKEKKIEFDCYS